MPKKYVSAAFTGRNPAGSGAADERIRSSLTKRISAFKFDNVKFFNTPQFDLSLPGIPAKFRTDSDGATDGEIWIRIPGFSQWWDNEGGPTEPFSQSFGDSHW